MWTEVVALEVAKKWFYFYSGYILKIEASKYRYIWKTETDGLNSIQYKRKKGNHDPNGKVTVINSV